MKTVAFSNEFNNVEMRICRNKATNLSAFIAEIWQNEWFFEMAQIWKKIINSKRKQFGSIEKNVFLMNFVTPTQKN